MKFVLGRFDERTGACRPRENARKILAELREANGRYKQYFDSLSIEEEASSKPTMRFFAELEPSGDPFTGGHRRVRWEEQTDDQIADGIDRLTANEARARPPPNKMVEPPAKDSKQRGKSPHRGQG